MPYSLRPSLGFDKFIYISQNFDFSALKLRVSLFISPSNERSEVHHGIIDSWRLVSALDYCATSAEVAIGCYLISCNGSRHATDCQSCIFPLI